MTTVGSPDSLMLQMNVKTVVWSIDEAYNASMRKRHYDHLGCQRVYEKLPRRQLAQDTLPFYRRPSETIANP